MKVKNLQSGFTLIEYIVVLVVAGIVAAMVSTYFGTALTQSSVPITRLQQVSNLRQVMENISADHNRLNQINVGYKWRFNTYYQKGAIVLPIRSTDTNNDSSQIENNGFYYICTKAGTSGSTVPTWSSTANIGDEVSDGSTVNKWQAKGYVWKAGTSYSAGSIVIPAIVNGHFYKTSGGTSGSNDPQKTTGKWPKTSGAIVSDGALTWTEVGTVLETTEVTDNLKNYLTNFPGRYDNNLNSYTVVTSETKFIQFNGTDEVDAGTSGTSSEKNILKVTIKNNSSTESLTQVFTIQ
jgi:prepilin-type N-terminal cleavage/methylation domain-containing protein